MFHYSDFIDECQEPILTEKLSDRGRTGKERPWREYKMANELLSLAYQDVDVKKSERLKACSKVLTFEVDNYGNRRLIYSDSCRVRLCPLCTWRRSLKNYYNSMDILSWIGMNSEKCGKFNYIFVTLTIKSCKGVDLSTTLDDLFSAVKRLYQQVDIKKAWLGMVRNLEVTHNVNYLSKDFDTYHPHFHMLVAVRPSYFTSRYYISQKKLIELWRKCLRADYDPVVDIRRTYGSTPQAVAETSKYAAKFKDFLIPDDWDLTVDTVRILDSVLNNRRLINYSGIFREVKKILKLEDADDGDLINVGDNSSVALEGEKFTESYFWYSGYRQYYKVDI